MIFYFDSKELKFFKAGEESSVRNKDIQFFILCKDIIQVRFNIILLL